MKKCILNMVIGVMTFASAALMEESPVFFSEQMIASHLKDYNDAEKAAIEQDLSVVRSICLQDRQEQWNHKKPVYLATSVSSTGVPFSRHSS